jgi:hypothetical protein
MDTYQQRMANIEKLIDLYNFRDELIEIVQEDEKNPKGPLSYSPVSQAYFFIGRIEERIKFLEAKGIFLDQIDSK